MVITTHDSPYCLENHKSKWKQAMRRKILKNKSSVDPLLYHSSLPYRFCYGSHLKLFVCIFLSLSSLQEGSLPCLVPKYRIMCPVGSLTSSLLECHFPGLWKQSSILLIPLSRQWDHPSSGPGTAASLLRLQWFTGKLPEVALVEHGTHESPPCWINICATVSWQRASANQAVADGAGLVPNSSFRVLPPSTPLRFQRVQLLWLL